MLYSRLIFDFRKENPRRPPFRSNNFTKTFLDWLLSQKNIKITYKHQKINSDSYNHIPDFFLNFLKEHTYFSKNIIVGIYIDKTQSSKDNYNIIKKEFSEIIRRHLKYNVLEKYSAKTYKINKKKVK